MNQATTNELIEADNRFQELDQRLDTLIAAAQQAEGRVAKVVALANATREVTAAVRAQWESLKELKNSPLGFLTDETSGKPPYTDNQLQVAITHGILLGAMPFAGEITVISGKAYLGLPHYKRRIAETAEITDLELQFGSIQQHAEKKALVEAVVTWKVAGEVRRLDLTKQANIDRRIPVRVNAGMGDDAVIGKAERKILKKVYELSTGRSVNDCDDDDKTIEGTATPAAPPAPPQPTIDELRSQFVAFRSWIRSAASLAELNKLSGEIFGPTWAPHWTDATAASLQRELDTRANALESSTKTDAMKRYQQELEAALTVKATGEIYDRHFGPNRSHDWTPAEDVHATELRSARNSQIRGQKS